MNFNCPIDSTFIQPVDMDLAQKSTSMLAFDERPRIRSLVYQVSSQNRNYRRLVPHPTKAQSRSPLNGNHKNLNPIISRKREVVCVPPLLYKMSTRTQYEWCRRNRVDFDKWQKVSRSQRSRASSARPAVAQVSVNS
jgi:hypothetical protein